MTGRVKEFPTRWRIHVCRTSNPVTDVGAFAAGKKARWRGLGSHPTARFLEGSIPDGPFAGPSNTTKCSVRGFPCESYRRCVIDAYFESVYICRVPTRKIQVGQVWKKDDSGESYLITKIYNEAIATFALLRKTGAEAEGTVKVKVDQRGPSQALPGFTYTQESDSF
jgi:hypothetical protein